MGRFTVEPAEGDLGAACACCAGAGGMRGFVYEDDDARAVYFVEPLGVPNYPLAKLGVAIGSWGAGTPKESRTVFAFMCKPGPQGPELTPSDPDLTPYPELSTLGERLLRADLAERSADLARFSELVRAILVQDWRLEPIRGGAAGTPQPAAGRFSADPA